MLSTTNVYLTPHPGPSTSHGLACSVFVDRFAYAQSKLSVQELEDGCCREGRPSALQSSFSRSAGPG